MNVRDCFPMGKRWNVRLHEKGGKEHEMPVHSVLEKYLDEYLQAAGIGEEKNTPLFRTAFRKTKRLTENRIHARNVLEMTKKRALQAGIATPITNHSFRATGITNYLRNGGTREKAQQMANHSSARTTQLYDRREDEVTVQEIEKVRFERIDVDVGGF
jgi:integrase